MYWMSLQLAKRGNSCSYTVMLYLLRKKYFLDVFNKTMPKL